MKVGFLPKQRGPNMGTKMIKSPVINPELEAVVYFSPIV
jgi:hypothetical protein